MTSCIVVVEIRVLPVVQKFLSYHYNTEPFLLTNNQSASAFSAYLYNCLDRYDHYDTKLPKRYSRLTQTMPVGVPDWVARTGHGVKLTPAKVFNFNRFVKQRFFETMTAEVTVRMAYGKGIVEATELFLGRYGITEEEMSVLKAMRYIGRYKKQMLIDDCRKKNVSWDVIL